MCWLLLGIPQQVSRDTAYLTVRLLTSRYDGGLEEMKMSEVSFGSRIVRIWPPLRRGLAAFGSAAAGRVAPVHHFGFCQ